MSGMILSQYDPSGPLVFLDIDGVLNDHNYNAIAKSSIILRRAVDSLNHVLVATDAQIVLTSAWRYMLLGRAMSIRGFSYLLRTHGVVADRLVGATCADEKQVAGPFAPILTTVLLTRGWQIQAWRRAHRHHGTYVVLDDMDLYLSPLHDGHFVQTNGKVGLTGNDANIAITILSAHSSRTKCDHQK